MKKKVLIAVPLILIIVSMLFGYGYYNLKSNSVYYAKNTPHKEGVEPVLMMLADNLDWIPNPNIDGIEYDFDAGKSINHRNPDGKDISWFGTFDGQKYIYGDTKYTLYGFDKKFKLLYVSKEGKGRVDIKNVDVKEVKKDIYKIVQPVIDRQTKPLINLQWIFDRVYRDKFN
ncbi:MAG: hypothetical protein PUK21_07455 [Peptostreptococcaceae bacterium]|nr:hypothetical protein [Peptostreptococcaceae bacterium]